MSEEEKIGKSILKIGWYNKNYKFLLLIPLVLLLICIVYLFNFNSIHNDLILKDVSLTGGTTASVFDPNIDLIDLDNTLKSQFQDLRVRGISDLRTGNQLGFIIESGAGVDEIKTALESYLGYKLTQENSSFEFTGAALSEGFYNQLRISILVAFIFMAIVVFLIFRSFIPSVAVVFSAFADIIMTLTVVNLLGMELGVAGVIAFLMLIGYSVDTDILLTSRILKRREGSVNSRIIDSFKTGITMTLTSIAAIAVALIIIFSFSEILRQIFTVLLIGLGFDILNTWFMNAGILKWYVEKKYGSNE
jgi:preprotein translocase subunit SecF